MTIEPEEQRVEWKEAWKDEWLRHLCGFANVQGGTLVLGRDDRGRAVGVPNSKLLLETLPNKIQQHLQIIPRAEHALEEVFLLSILWLPPVGTP